MSANHEREVRAARNQAMFRAVNEKLRELNDAMSAASGTFVIACECADTTCIATLEIDGDEYERIRSHPNRFAVLTGHVFLEVEGVVDERDHYVIVEKHAAGAELAVSTDPRKR